MPYLVGYPTPQDYGALGNGVHDDTSAINSALAALPVGGALFFPPGAYEISSPLTPVVAGTKMFGVKASSGYSAGGSNQTTIDALAGFTGSAMVNVSGVADFAVRDLTIHGTNTTGTTIGLNITTSGSCMLENVLVARTAGDGIYLSGVDPVVMRQVGVYHAGIQSNAGYGINIQGIADSWYTNVLCAGCYNAGWNIQGGDNSTFTACRAEDSPAGYGFYFHDKSGLFGGTSFVQCTTDLNFADGFRIANLSGNGVIQLVGCEFRRDGNNNSAGGGSYSGIAVVGTTIPVLLSGTTVTARQGVSGADAPQYGLTMTTSSLVTADGGYFSCAASGGSVYNHDSNGVLQLGPNIIGATVSAGTPTVYQLGEIVARKTSTQSVNNSTTLVNDTQLVTPSLLPNSVWLVEGVIFYDASTAGDFKLAWTAPSGATLTWSGMGGGTGASSAPVNMGDQQRTLASAASYGGVGVGTIVDVIVRGVLTISSTAGPLQMQFAQNTADATNCTVDVGSFLRLKQIA